MERKELERRSKAELIELLLNQQSKLQTAPEKEFDWSKYDFHHVAFKVEGKYGNLYNNCLYSCVSSII